jgi:hypothetical protein
MPLTGNRLGSKVAAEYISDGNQTYNLKIDADLYIAGSGLALGAGGTPRPGRFKPRGVHAQLLDSGKIYRKFFVCNATGGLYISNTPTGVTCDGATFTTTGRRGERQSF